MPLWSDSYLQQLTNDAETELCSFLTPLFKRFTLAVTADTATYTLNDYVHKIQRVTWKGEKLTPLTFSELVQINPDFENQGSGVPKYYLYMDEGLKVIRFYPTPDETIGASDTNVNKLTGVNARVIISCFRSPDLTDSDFQIPSYIARRTVKAFVLSKAYRVRNEGQNLIAADYYKAKYEGLKAAYVDVKAKHFSPIIRTSLGKRNKVPARARYQNDQTIG